MPQSEPQAIDMAEPILQEAQGFDQDTNGQVTLTIAPREAESIHPVPKAICVIDATAE
jgi:hypothetical protein